MQNLNTINTNRITPFTVGFEELFDKLYDLESSSVGFPPYNIIKVGENNYLIEMALAGYKKKRYTGWDCWRWTYNKFSEKWNFFKRVRNRS